MSIKVEDGAPNTNGTVVTPTPGTELPQAKNILDLMQSMQTASQLSDAGREYVTKIAQALGIKEPIRLPSDKFESVIFTDSGMRGVLIIFAETYRNLEGVPATEFIRDIAARFKSMGGTLLESVVINDYDYRNVDRMVSWLSNTFTSNSDPRVANLSVSTLIQTDYYVVTDMTEVRNFITAYSPHSVPERDDIGALVCAVVPKQNVFGGRTETEYRPIFAFTGYTEMVANNSSAFGTRTQFIPIVTISSIVSALPARNLIGFVLPLAADLFIRRGLWLRPYSQFAADRPNLGTLITEEGTTNMWFAKDIPQRNAFLSQYVVQPSLAVDVTDGRARIAGLDNLIWHPEKSVADVANFLGQSMNMINPVMLKYTNYVGTVAGNKGELPVDSRTVDYLNLATDIKSIDRLRPFLYQPPVPFERMRQIKDLKSDVVTLYSSTRAVLDVTYVKFLATALSQAGMKITYDSMNNQGEFSFDALLAANSTNNFSNLTGFGTGGGGYVGFGNGSSPYDA